MLHWQYKKSVDKISLLFRSEMGIKKLNPFLEKNCGRNYIEIPLEQLTGMAIGVDTSLYMYKFKSRATSCVVDATDFLFDEEQNCWNDVDSKKITSLFLVKFANFIRLFYLFNIIPVFVLDGEYPEQKKNKQKERKDNQLKKAQKQSSLKRNNCSLREYCQAIKNNIFITIEDRNNIVNLLLSMGCLVVQAKGEAEKLAAYHTNQGKVFATLSEDTDLYLYGCKVIMTSINFKKRTATMVAFQDILQSLKMTKEQFITLCILSGNDYNNNIYNFGVPRCYDLIMQHGTYDEIVKVKPDFVNIPFHETFEFVTSVPEEDGIICERLDQDQFRNLFTYEDYFFIAKVIEEIRKNSDHAK